MNDSTQAPTIEEAADLIWREAEAGRYFPDALRGSLSMADGLRVQLALLARERQAGLTLGGWKIGLTSARVRERYGTEDQPFGHLLAERMLESPAVVAMDQVSGTLAVEPELCFILGRRLEGPRVTKAEAHQAVAAVHAAFELNESRNTGEADFGLTVADNMSQWGLVRGAGLAPVPDGPALQELAVEVRRNGETVTTAVGRDVIDDHFRSLSVLANLLAEHGLALEAGQRVITGSFSKHNVSAGETWSAHVAGIGAVEVRFT